MEPHKSWQEQEFNQQAAREILGYFGVDRQYAAAIGTGFFRELKDVENDRQLAFLELRPGMRLLDVGCNIGEMLLRVRATYGVDGFGIDLSPGVLARAKQVLTKISRGDAEDLPFASGSFDRVMTFDVMEHMPHPELFVSEIARVLKPGGKCLIYAVSKQNAFTWHAFLRLVTLGRMGHDVTGGHDPEKFIPPADIRKFAAASGLREIGLVPFHSFFTLAFDEFGARGISFAYKRLARRDPSPRPAGFPDGTVRSIAGMMKPLHALLGLLDLPWTVTEHSNGFYFLAEKPAQATRR